MLQEILTFDIMTSIKRLECEQTFKRLWTSDTVFGLLASLYENPLWIYLNSLTAELMAGYVTIMQNTSGFFLDLILAWLPKVCQK